MEIEKVLPWREKGWVTADTHVHFLSPTSALLEGAGEGVNVVNLLASQWGELMTNVGDFDGKTSWGDLYSGIDPYSLADWYRYLHCGYPTAAVGGTDKMSAGTAVGTVRTYTRIKPDKEFDYESWLDAVRRMETFVTYGPLLDFSVEGKPMGSRLKMAGSAGGEGAWSVKVDRSSWLALLVRGHYPDKPEIIAAHSSAVMVEVEGSEFYGAADALTILEQIEGALAYLDTVGTRAETMVYKRMRLVLESAHREIHNRMHRMGHFHEHTPVADH